MKRWAEWVGYLPTPKILQFISKQSKLELAGRTSHHCVGPFLPIWTLDVGTGGRW